MPMPPAILYATNSLNDADTAQPTADTVNSTADKTIAFLRPR